ncbi:hypothetical protein CTAYLR_003227 [Chrysophaeum taylorii]|uniref:Cullin family profile domain-containing protein n=1 Tax=Chrysophaeum taylorii TaxID=2483200 RepID=A0AAD7XMB1_9STRA|nr:hypothetical protein CTAYLR_003227 [Chrysophaeum taylorii]
MALMSSSTNHKATAAAAALGPGWEAEQWKVLESAVSTITEGGEIVGSREELYRRAEDLCVEGFGEALYERVARALYAGATAKARSVREKDEVLGSVAAAWQAHAAQTKAIRSIFRYLDRTSTGVVGLWEAGTAAFRAALEAEPGLEAGVIEALREACRPGRDDEAPGAARDACRMLSELGAYGDFEKLALRDFRDFYAAEGRRLGVDDPDAARNARKYVDATYERLRSAERAVDSFLDPGTRAPLVATLEEYLVAPHAARICRASYGALVDASDLDTLERLDALAGRVGASDAVREATRHYALERASRILLRAEGGDPRELLDLHARLSKLCVERLDGSSWAGAVLKDAFEEAVNDERVAASFAEALATAFGRIVADEKSIDSFMLLFGFTRSKDVFEAFYRRELATRLLERETSRLRKGSSHLEGERRVIKKLEAECGASYVSKIEGMCKDVDLAKTVASDYSKLEEKAPDLHPTVLTTGYWPAYPRTALVLPAELSKLKTHFQDFYASRFRGRRLAWHHDLERCVVRVFYEDARKELDASMAQTVVLLCFNRATYASLDDLRRATRLDADDLDRVLASLSTPKLRVLVQQDVDSIRANPAFSHKSYLVKLPNPRAPDKLANVDRAKVVDAVARDRQYSIDAAIVRVMKARKTLPHHQLVADLLARLKHPATPAEIKKRIESLIDREYIERDPHNSHSYTYLA